MGKMEHLDKHKMLEHMAGRLEEPAAEQLHRHLDECPECRDAYAALGRAWQTLDSWEVMIGDRDIWPAIQEATAAARRSRLRIWSVLLIKIIAVLAILSVLGYLLIRLDPRDLADPGPPEPPLTQPATDASACFGGLPRVVAFVSVFCK